jgi:hypothetical protein
MGGTGEARRACPCYIRVSLIMKGISYEFIFIVTTAKLVLDLIGERVPRTTQKTGFPLPRE